VLAERPLQFINDLIILVCDLWMRRGFRRDKYSGKKHPHNTALMPRDSAR